MSRESVFNRFFSKVAIGDGCWNWLGSRRGRGYGAFSLRGRMEGAHRVSFELWYGAIPRGQGYHGTCVLHRCDNPQCVRPSHLFLGNNMENARDKARKGRGRSARGARHPRSKLTAEQVRMIRRRRTQGELLRVLAAEYGVSTTQIGFIAQRRAWGHLED